LRKHRFPRPVECNEKPPPPLVLFSARPDFPADFLLFAVLVLVFVVYNRRREAHIKYPGPDDDVRENIINYDDEGGGEDDMTAFDITPLQIPIGGPLPELAPPKLGCKPSPVPHGKKSKCVFFVCPVSMIGVGQEPNVGVFIEEHKKRADSDPNAPPFDDLRNYAYEGGGSTAGSLSSLASGEAAIFPPLIFMIAPVYRLISN
jgi:hypothetical protein